MAIHLWPPVTRRLMRPTRGLGSAPLPRRSPGPGCALLFGLAPGGVCRVSLRHPTRRPATASSLWHWSSSHDGRALPATLRCGARTFLTSRRGYPAPDARPSGRLADRGSLRGRAAKERPAEPEHRDRDEWRDHDPPAPEHPRPGREQGRARPSARAAAIWTMAPQPVASAKTRTRSGSTSRIWTIAAALPTMNHTTFRASTRPHECRRGAPADGAIARPAHRLTPGRILHACVPAAVRVAASGADARPRPARRPGPGRSPRSRARRPRVFWARGTWVARPAAEPAERARGPAPGAG